MYDLSLFKALEAQGPFLTLPASPVASSALYLDLLEATRASLGILQLPRASCPVSSDLLLAAPSSF